MSRAKQDQDGLLAHKAGQLRAKAETEAAALSGLLLAAERLATALSAGAHGLRRAGQGEEFWQYRAASAGDSLRVIDWRRSARSDLQFVREREVQSAQSALIWINDGPGMDYAGGPDRPRKSERAKLLALAYAIALLRGGEKVALVGQMPRAGRVQADRIAFDLMTDDGSATENPPAQALAPGQKVLLISDFLGDPQPMQDWVARAAASGVKGAMLQVLDPDEESFPFGGAVRFRMAGGLAHHETRDAAGIREAYLTRLAERRALLQQVAGRSGWHFGTHDTLRPAAQALLWIASVMES